MQVLQALPASRLGPVRGMVASSTGKLSPTCATQLPLSPIRGQAMALVRQASRQLDAMGTAAAVQRIRLHQAGAAAYQRRTAPQRPVAAAAAPTVAAAVPAPENAGALKISAYVFLWYAFNIVFNLLNKSTLNIFPAPWFLATFQLVASGAFMCALWALRLQPLPQVSWTDIRALAPVALLHTIGHVSACISFSQMAVSFAHVVKSAEPVLSVVLAQAILKEVYPYYVWLSLLPIIVGCSLAAMKEVSFAWSGFNSAMISNVGMVLRNVYSKKFLGQLKLDGINLFAILSIISIFYCLPCALVFEGFKGGVNNWAPMWESAVLTSGSLASFAKLLAAGGIFYHLYNQASYMVLDQGISPVTFSVGNTMKRVAVVISSVLFFKNPVSAMNWVGSMVALLGTGLYSLAKQKASDDAKVAEAATHSVTEAPWRDLPLRG